MPYLHAHRGYYKASEMFCIVTLSIIIIIIIISVITIILILKFVLLLLCYVGYCITIVAKPNVINYPQIITISMGAISIIRSHFVGRFIIGPQTYRQDSGTGSSGSWSGSCFRSW